ncbi:MAG: T9SS type A sorting domain-containing protein, partial [Lentimicrobium sp.]|nr:T9SS type A sorting domain-containing protein [Lentimicrobium sp.]
TELASWYGELTFTPGLALLSHTIIMPQTFLDSDIYENTATAVPYGMALDTLKYGIWLTNHNYMKFSPLEGKATLTGYGTAPVMVLTNEGALAGFSQQTGTGNSGTPRMIAGFEKLRLDLIDYTTPFIMGNVSSAGIQKAAIPRMQVNPNPVVDVLTFSSVANATEWTITGIDGKVLKTARINGNEISIDLKESAPGIYIIRLTDSSNQTIASGRFIKK